MSSTRAPLAAAAMVMFLVLVAIVAKFWWAGAGTLEVDGVRDMLLDARHVELQGGFGGLRDLIIWQDVEGVNPDRPGIAVMMPREGKIVWRVSTHGGRFTTRVGRRQKGPQADDSVCTVRFTVPGSEGVQVEVAVPPCPADPMAPPGVLREGPLSSVTLQLPDPCPSLEIETTSGQEVPADSAVVLVSPRVTLPSRQVDAEDVPLRFRRAERLLPRVDTSKQTLVFAERRAEGSQQVSEVRVPGFTPTGSFSGREARPAIALAAGAELSLTVDIHADTVLAGALALDDRLPPGTWADVIVTMDDRVVTTELVKSRAWREVEVPLGRFAGEGRRLGVRVDTWRLEPAWVEKIEPDFTRGVHVPVAYRASRVVVGLGEPRLERSVSVPRALASARHPSVLLIQVETLRADLLPFFGGGPAGLTPNLDRLAREGKAWRSAFAPSPWTVPSTATLLTGLSASAHGAINHVRTVLPGDVPTLAERARDHGVVCGAVVASDVLRPRMGFARGFETYAHVPYVNARQVNDLAVTWMADHVGQRFLLFLHYFDPHHPFNAPGEYRERYVEDALQGADARAAHDRLVGRLTRRETIDPDDPDMRLLRQRYLGEIAFFDQRLGDLLDALEALGLAETTTVVFTSDHGEEFLEHGIYGHGSHLYDESLWVPLVIRSPAQAVAATVDEVTGTAGLCSTVLGLLDVPFEIESMVPPVDQGHAWVFSETNKGIVFDGRGDPLRRFETSVRTATDRLIWKFPLEGEEGTGSGMLFDLTLDPDCQQPLPVEGQAGRRLQALMRQALQWSDSHRGIVPDAGGDLEWLRTLEQLGYTGGGR